MYRKIKKEPAPEIYVASKNSVGVRRVIAGLRLGCLPLAVEVGRYTCTPYTDRVCSLRGTGEAEDRHHFLINCPSLSHIRQKLFMHCNSILISFHKILLLISVNFYYVTQLAQQCSFTNTTSI